MFDIDKECIEEKRENSTTKEEMYMLLALSAASNSKDPSTQVGACYVSKDGKVISVGCNSVPPLWDEDNFPWGTKEEYEIKNNKYTYIIHAEMAGATNCKCSLKDFENGTLYVTLFPCTNCAKLIASLGIKRIVYLNARINKDFECANILFKNTNIECIKFIDVINSIKSLELDTDGDEKSCIKIKKRSLL